ncbi:MAG: DUF3336 domain-containing protein [Halieaceae bacterium]
MGNKRKMRNLDARLNAAESYERWFEIAAEHDTLSGMDHWRGEEETDLYDHAQIRLRLDRLKALRKRKDYQGLLFALNEGIHGNMGGMGKSVLYRMAKCGTKYLIEEYIDEIDSSLRLLAELDDDIIPIQQKIEFFYRANICFGRSALMLSGGGILGFLHLGVVNVLAQQGLLPRVISGSSAGALVAGVLACLNDDELLTLQDPTLLHREADREASFFRRMLGSGSHISLEDLEGLVDRLVPDMTFQEAYAKTGRQVSITVAPAEPHQRSRLLNAVASPNVYIRSAVMASCAVPGVFPPVMLMAKNVHGEAQPYLPGRRWVDGSVADDLPAKRLSRLFGTNHHIVSMVNPIATAFLSKDEDRHPLSKAAGTFGVGLGREVLNFYRGIAQRQGDSWPRFNMMMHGLHALMDQEYTGDINIIPSFRMANPVKLLSHIDDKQLLEIVEHGQRACYEKVEAIRRCTVISRTLEEILYRFEYGDLRPDARKYRRPRSSRRRPPPTKQQLEVLKASSKTDTDGARAENRKKTSPASPSKRVTTQRGTSGKRGTSKRGSAAGSPSRVTH